MALTPLDIHNKEFHVKLRGYDQDEVNDFLDQIIKDYENTLKENDRLADSLQQNKEKLKYFNDLKDSLNQSIIVAQEAADKVKANSQKEAEIITPAENPNNASIIPFLTSLNKNTIEAPRVVILQVNKDAISACVTGDNSLKKSNIISHQYKVCNK